MGQLKTNPYQIMNTESKKKGPPKGISNNPSGRPKGSKNKVTAELKTFIARFLKKNSKTLQQDWDKLSSYQRVVMTEKLLPFVLPKVNDGITQEEIDEFLNTIRKTASK